MASKSFRAPNGTQDSYPLDLLRRRWLIEHWRRVSTRHGFEEIDGPTFEHLDLYKAKSGDGIVSELFSFRRAGGKDDYALRPEFTPTLARMYAAKANSLPKPTKWFCTGNFFRAERPQRGRRREFWQWNADVIGLEGIEDTVEAKARADAEVIACVVELFRSLGLSSDDARVCVSDRNAAADLIRRSSGDSIDVDAVFVLLDKRGKLDAEAFTERAIPLGFDVISFDTLVASQTSDVLLPLLEALAAQGVSDWITPDFNIARGLAYYTGTVFEVIAEGERAIAGGGRYDHLIELFGGPPTPAVGFGMGDVVLTNLLVDKGLMPSDGELMEWAGQSPTVFVIASDDDSMARLRPTVAALRSAGLHARHSYKATRNTGKLLKEANTLGAHSALLLEDVGQAAKIKHLRGDGGQSETMPLERAVEQLAELFRPSDDPPAVRGSR